MFVVTGSLFGEPRKRLLDSTFVTRTLETTGGHASVPPISATSDYAIPSSKRLRVNTHQHAGSERLMSTNDPLTTLGGVQIPVNNSATHVHCYQRDHMYTTMRMVGILQIQFNMKFVPMSLTPVNVRMSMEDFTAGINHSGPSTSKRRRVHSHEHGGNYLVIGSVSSDRAHEVEKRSLCMAVTGFQRQFIMILLRSNSILRFCHSKAKEEQVQVYANTCLDHH
uniref:Uncharacterized protein n=1 Tax=Tanacetum cinerariifolium TaxID=118510 RepID=A0A6L2LZR4_TANCI|nr:hypothetical protein [Tanacetum cinerariifolium]GEV08658.1 hypothetical protein [Tanacetum cinerariifolium]